MRPKILICLIIICVGTYMLTSSMAITAGVAILMYVLDRIVKGWADKKDQQYFYGGTTNDNETENNTNNG